MGTRTVLLSAAALLMLCVSVGQSAPSYEPQREAALNYFQQLVQAQMAAAQLGQTQADYSPEAKQQCNGAGSLCGIFTPPCCGHCGFILCFDF